MPLAAPPGKDTSARLLLLAFAAVVGSFLAAIAVIQRSSAAVTNLSEQIIENSAPSIERLSAVRRSVLETELALSRFVHEPGSRAEVRPVMTVALQRAAAETSRYISMPAFAGERALIEAVQHSWLAFENAVQETEGLAGAGDDAAARTRLATAVEPARARLLEDITGAIELNATTGRDLASAIRDIRRRSNRLAAVLGAICTVLGIVAAWLLQRQVRARRALLEAHTRLVEARADELEQFSGRVAHDIRNPIATARMGAELVLRKTSDERVADLARRIMSSLSRANAITTALLEFARSGARPDPGARTDVRAAVADALAGVASDAERARITIRCGPVPPVLASCSEGVYLSLVTNLVRNAIKYMGNAPLRAVEVKVSETAGIIRTEVRDTGPGIAADALPSLFDPYFRAHRRDADGLGLGLATVKKLAEGHGGHAGVQSTPGKGSTFWFELPGARVAGESAEDLERTAEPAGDLRH